MSRADRISKKDLDAFRIGIEEQARSDERQKLWRAEMDRDLKKRSLSKVKFVSAAALLEGDVLAESHGITGFRECDVVCGVSDSRHRPDGRMWIETNTGGQAVLPSAQILIEDRGF